MTAKTMMARIFAPVVLTAGLMMAPIAVSAASAAPSLPAYGPTTCSFTITVTPSTVHRGDRFTVTISGTCFGVTFTIQIHSTTETLGTMTTDGSGNATASFVAPTDLPDGTHTVSATSSVGSSETTPIVVSGGPYTGAVTSTTPSSSLPLTGSDAVGTAGAGAAAVLVGGVLVLSVRKRRSSRRFS